MAIPPNKPVIRVDENDLVYRTIDGKFNAVADDIAARHAKGQPCLIGTVSIENSEKLSRLLDKRGIKHDDAERQAPRARGAYRGPGRAPRRRHHRHQHGRPRYRHPLGGEPDMLAEDLLRERGFDVERPRGRRGGARPHPIGRRPRRRPHPRPRDLRRGAGAGARRRGTLRHRHRAPRVPPHRQPAARPFRPSGRPGRDPASTCRWRTTSCVCSAARRWTPSRT